MAPLATFERKLMDAIKDGAVGRVQSLLDKGADVNAKNEYGNTPLHWAAAYGDMRIAQLLIKEGAEVNETNLQGDTPMHSALRNAEVDMARLLIENGADVSVRNTQGKTPLDYAREEVRHALKEVVRRATQTADRQPGLG